MNAFISSALDYAVSVKIRVSLFYLLTSSLNCCHLVASVIADDTLCLDARELETF